MHRLHNVAGRAAQLLPTDLALVIDLRSAAQPAHLPGFVDRLCDAEACCFGLRVKPAFRDALGERIRVRIGAGTRLFDPENYALTLALLHILPGSHLRLLI